MTEKKTDKNCSKCNRRGDILSSSMNKGKIERITDGGIFILDEVPTTIDIPNSCRFKDALISYFTEIENKAKSIQIKDVGCNHEIKSSWPGLVGYSDYVWPTDVTGNTIW